MIDAAIDELAPQLDKTFVALELTLEPDEVLRRVANLKLTDVKRASQVIDGGQTLPTHWPELRQLAIDGLTAAEVAERAIVIADESGIRPTAATKTETAPTAGGRMDQQAPRGPFMQNS